MEVIRREYDDEEVIRVVGNVSAPISCRVMLRMDICDSALVRQQAEKGVGYNVRRRTNKTPERQQ